MNNARFLAIFTVLRPQGSKPPTPFLVILSYLRLERSDPPNNHKGGKLLHDFGDLHEFETRKESTCLSIFGYFLEFETRKD